MSLIQSITRFTDPVRGLRTDMHWRGNVPGNFNFVNYRKTRFYLI